MTEKDEPNIETLSPSERALLAALRRLIERGKSGDGDRAHDVRGGKGGEGYTVDEVLSAGIDYPWKGEVEVMNAASWLKTKGMVDIRERIHKSVVLGKEGWHYVKKGLPEKELIAHLEEGMTNIKDLTSSGLMAKDSIRIALSNLKILGIRITGGKIEVPDLEAVKNKVSAREEALKTIEREKEVPLESMEGEVLDNLLGRKDVVKIKERVVRYIIPLDKGMALMPKIGGRISAGVSQLRPEDIQSGRWRELDIRPYDITAFAPPHPMARPHPLSELIDDIRGIFVGMGFEEIKGPFVHSAFWNMDALFIPQDHPARDMQDTLYTINPETIDIDEDLADIIARIHRDGGPTGSCGWGYEWDKRRAMSALLRTHTTVETIRYLATHRNPPVRVFSIDRVFRNEAIDATHLPEFHQIEGIIMEKDASFAMLLGVLKEFYARMGFEDIRFRPAYFPYTEPSLEVEVNFHGKWMELGGAGIFRPEVTSPFGIKYPVLAWGLGLERLAMNLFRLDDIRDLYMSDLEWLRSRPAIPLNRK